MKFSSNLRELDLIGIILREQLQTLIRKSSDHHHLITRSIFAKATSNHRQESQLKAINQPFQLVMMIE